MFRYKSKIRLVIVYAGMLLIQSCKNNDWMVTIPNQIKFETKLSAYQIYKGKLRDLIPNQDFKLYELSTSLFTDYAEKQRLIKLPTGKKLRTVNDGLPDFPDSTIIVKTFFYYKDKRNPVLGKQIIETRLLMKLNGNWNVATYQWNDVQTDATLISTGLDQNLNWINEQGENKNIAYHIPNMTECNSCHQSAGSNIPIGPKIRNLNRNVMRDGKSINQLTYLQNMTLLEPINLSNFTELPNWEDPSQSLERRSRAYLDVNCAHCHSDNGVCKKIVLRMAYETPFQNSFLKNYKKSIIVDLEKRRMPKLGTTIVHQEGIDQLIAYLNTL